MTPPNDAVSHREDAPPEWHGPASDAGQNVADKPSAESSLESPVSDPTPVLRIRPYSIADIPTLVRMRGTLRLDVPDSLVLPKYRSVDLPGALPILRRDRPTFVAIAHGQQVGFVRFSPRRPDGRWVVSAIAASTGVYPSEPVWEALLAHGVRAAGLRGVRRLFARVPAGHPLIDTMRQNGWIPYARETVFRAERLSPVSRSTRDLRLQDPADTWAIHQLYTASVPRQVQEIEAITSHNWHMDQPRRTQRSVRQTGWLLEENAVLAAYARYTRDSQIGMIDALVAPGQDAHLGALLDGVIAEPKRSRSRPVYCALRTYHLDLRDVLSDRGFSEIGEQELLIRYTTATVRIPAIDPMHFPVELRPAMPRRVPTFLEGQPTDGAI